MQAHTPRGVWAFGAEMNINSMRQLDTIGGEIKTCIACNQSPVDGTLHIIVPTDKPGTTVRYVLMVCELCAARLETDGDFLWETINRLWGEQ